MATYEDILNYPLSSWDSKRDEEIAEHLQYVDCVDTQEESCSFSEVAFWVRKADGQILYGYDSGCSCPMPFEDILVKDLQETTLAGVEAAVLEHWWEQDGDSYYGVSRADIQQRIRSIKKAIEAAGGK